MRAIAILFSFQSNDHHWTMDNGPQTTHYTHSIVCRPLSVVHRHEFLSAISMALSMALALLTVSWYSLAGSESATMPAPACTLTVFPCATRVRMAMQVSIA